MTPPRLWFATPAIALFGLLLTSVARGAPPEGETSKVRYQRGAPKIEARNELRTRFLEAQKKAEAAKAEERAAELEDMRERERAAKAEAINMALTDAKIDKLKELVRQTDQDSAELPDLLMRLADLHLDKKAHFDLQAGALSEQIYEAENGVVTPPAAAPAKTPAAAPSTPAAPDKSRGPKGRKHRRSRR
jgi:predicted phage gp36 major capsid-like protein